MLLLSARYAGSVRLLALSTLLCVAGASALLAAPAAKSKKSTAKKSASGKPATKKAATALLPLGPAVAIQGGGDCSFKASFVKGTSNVAFGSFDSPGRAESGGTSMSPSLSSGQASTKREGSSLICVIEAPPEAIAGGGRRTRSINLTLVARGGFHAGQRFPIALFPAVTDKPKVAYCFIGYGEEEAAEREIIGKRRGWGVTSGTLRIDSVSQNRLAFSVLNARCNVAGSREENANNFAIGAFTMNGKGVFTVEN